MVRLIVFVVLMVPLATGFVLWAAYFTIASATDSLVFDDLESIPEREVGVVLGTTPRLRDGNPNAYFDYRMDAAARLWRAGKVQRLILSGDNLDRRYDEPKYMRNALLERGVDDEAMTLDRGGIRTFDSIMRARITYGTNDPIVISQEFHNRRALFIARHYDIDAIGFNARDVAPDKGLRTKLRESFARVKTLLDLWVLGTRPQRLDDLERERGEPSE